MLAKIPEQQKYMYLLKITGQTNVPEIFHGTSFNVLNLKQSSVVSVGNTNTTVEK